MQDFIKSIFAGIMIGIAGMIYLNVPDKTIGAILFSIGLIIICIKSYNLYTGKVGYVKTLKEILQMLKYILGNLIGAFLVSTTFTGTTDIVLTKLQVPMIITFLKAIGCGFLMYLAVDIYKEKKSVIGIICCIPAFILAGFEHSIADIFYIFCNHVYNIEVLMFIILVILGNAVGAQLHRLIK